MTETQAGPELDAEIARRVFGREVIPCDAVSDAGPLHGHVVQDGAVRQCNLNPYSTSIAAAWFVVEKMRAMGVWLAIRPVSDMHVDIDDAGARWRVASFNEECVPYNDDWDSPQVSECAATAPLAICRAALLCCAERSTMKHDD